MRSNWIYVWRGIGACVTVGLIGVVFAAPPPHQRKDQWAKVKDKDAPAAVTSASESFAVTAEEEAPLSAVQQFIASAGTQFQLQWDSPAIDAGTDMQRGSDMIDNPIYGAPDIGAFEYQPPYTMGVEALFASGRVRIYSDGKFRHATVGIGSAELSVAPTAGWGAFGAGEARPFWMDLDVTNWDIRRQYYRRWTENAPALNSSATAHVVGQLAPERKYNLSVNGVLGSGITGPSCVGGVCTSDAQGKIEFTYTGDYATTVFELEVTLLGDFDNDGDVDADDIDLLQVEVLAGTNDPAYDLAGTLVVDVNDMDEMIHIILATEYGDASLDGQVGLDDLSALAASWDAQSGMGWGDGDFNGDGAVNLDDLSIMAANWGWSAE